MFQNDFTWHIEYAGDWVHEKVICFNFELQMFLPKQYIHIIWKKLTDVVDMAVIIWSLYTYNPQFLSVLFLIPFKQCILYIRIFCYIFCEIKVPIRTKTNRSSHLKTLSEPNTRATWQLRLCLRSSRYEGQCSFDWIAALRFDLLNYWLFSKGDLWRLFLLPLHELHPQLWLWGQMFIRIKK